MVDAFREPLRAPLLHDPSEGDLEYEDVTFPAVNGVPLAGWFIPATGSSKIIVMNRAARECSNT